MPTATTTTTTTATAVELAEGLRDVIERHVPEGDSLRRLADPIVGAFADHNLLRVLLPNELGGDEMDPVEYLRLIEQVSYFDASAAWNLAIASGSSLIAGYLPEDRAKEIFGRPDACIAGSFLPNGRGLRVSGGYRVTGRWGWASGIHHATWLVGACVILDEDGSAPDSGPPLIRHFLVPKSESTFVDTWHVGGMRATGSADYELSDVFVPDDLVFQYFGPRIVHPAPVFRLPSTFFGIAVSLIPSGAARACVDALIELAADKVSMMNRSKLKDRASAQYDVAKAQAMIESTQMFVLLAMQELWEAILEGREITPALRARVRRATVHAAESAAEVAARMYRTAGASALSEHGPFARRHRDVAAALAHVTVQRSMMEDAGRVAFGLDPLSPIF